MSLSPKDKNASLGPVGGNTICEAPEGSCSPGCWVADMYGHSHQHQLWTLQWLWPGSSPSQPWSGSLREPRLRSSPMDGTAFVELQVSSREIPVACFRIKYNVGCTGEGLRGMVWLSPHLCSPRCKKSSVPNKSFSACDSSQEGRWEFGCVSGFPRCVGLRERLTSPGSSRAPSPGLQDCRAGRGLEKGRSVLKGPVIGLDPVLRAAHSQKILQWPSEDTCPWNPPSWPMGTPALCSSAVTPHRHQSCSQFSVPALTVVKTSIGRWMGTRRKQLESGGVWERPRTGA